MVDRARIDRAARTVVHLDLHHRVVRAGVRYRCRTAQPEMMMVRVRLGLLHLRRVRIAVRAQVLLLVVDDGWLRVAVRSSRIERGTLRRVRRVVPLERGLGGRIVRPMVGEMDDRAVVLGHAPVGH